MMSFHKILKAQVDAPRRLQVGTAAELDALLSVAELTNRS
jgi:hypothetical protein